MKWIWLPALVVFLLSSIKVVQAQSENVAATVKLSICGNADKEGGEECDNNDLNQQTCRSLGYLAGNLDCYSYCEFDTSQCFGVAPSPTPTPTPTPTLTTQTSNNNSAASSTNSNSSNGNAAAVSEIVTQVVQLVQTPAGNSGILPVKVRFFDPNDDEVLVISELRVAVSSWVAEFKQIIEDKPVFVEGIPESSEEVELIQRCDVNTDNRCDLTDLSVLLYYFKDVI